VQHHPGGDHVVSGGYDRTVGMYQSKTALHHIATENG
jgi:hypothetical protein